MSKTTSSPVDRPPNRVCELDDVRCYLRAADWPPAGDCELCEEGRRAGTQARARHSPSRLKS